MPRQLFRLRSGKIFLEDGSKQTNNYEVLYYNNARTDEEMNFICFKDKDLNVPVAFNKKLIEQSQDNDCHTDEEQIERSIETLFSSLQEAIKGESLTQPSRKRRLY